MYDRYASICREASGQKTTLSSFSGSYGSAELCDKLGTAAYLVGYQTLIAAEVEVRHDFLVQDPQTSLS